MSSILRRIRWGRVSLAGAAVVGLGMWAAAPCESTSCGSMTAEVEAMKPPGTELLANRPWVDHMPRNERDMVTQVVFLDRGGKKQGAMQRASKWRVVAELFRWDTRRGGLTVEFPQVGRKLPVNAKAYACKGKGVPKGFDLCLDVSLLGRGVQLYSKKSWKIGSLDEVSDLLEVDPDAVDLSDEDERLFEELVSAE